MQMAVSSDRPLKEVRSNITVPRPFTFSTEKRAAAPTSTRDSSQRHSVSKATNRLDQPTGHKKRMPYVQVILRLDIYAIDAYEWSCLSSYIVAFHLFSLLETNIN